MPRSPRPTLSPLTIPPPELTQSTSTTSNLPSHTPEATHTIPLTPPPSYRSAPPARQPWHTSSHPSNPKPKADRWAKPVRAQRAMRDAAHKAHQQTQNHIELESRGRDRDLEGQKEMGNEMGKGKGKKGGGKGKGYLGPKSSNCGRWVVVLVVCAVIVAVAFLVAHAVTSVR